MNSSAKSRSQWQLCGCVAVLFSLLFSLHLTSLGQVTIKERVELGGGQINKFRNGSFSPYASNDFFVVPHAGVIAIVPLDANKVIDPFPSGAVFEVSLSDTTYTLLLSQSLPNHNIQTNVYWWTCTVYTPGTAHDYDQGENPDTLFTRRLQAGDTVRFALQGEFYNPSSWIYWADYCNCGAVGLATPSPPGCQEPNTPPEQSTIFFELIDTTVTITRPDSAVVYPTYLGHNNATGANDTINLELRVMLGNDSIPNYWVKILKPTLVDSGGHSHDGNRPMGKYKYPRDTTANRDSIVARTDNTGRIKFRYVASQFGGVERIKAILVSDTTKFDTLSLMTRVPGLLPFPAGVNYSKTGGTCTHYGPGNPSGCTTPDNNHYFVSQTAIDSLTYAASQFKKAKWNTTGNMRLNDMSLPLGGLFDKDGKWRRPHKAHRIGRSVDIENLQMEQVDTVSIYTGRDTSFTIPKVKFVKDFVNFMEVQMRHWHFEKEGQDSSNVFGRTRKYPHFEWRGN